MLLDRNCFIPELTIYFPAQMDSEYIDVNDIKIRKVQKKCILFEIEISVNKVMQKMMITLPTMYESVKKTLKKELTKLKVFFFYFGREITPLNDKITFRDKIKLHPEWNRIYGPGHTYWMGPLQDGVDRGPHSYYCPIG